MFTIPTEITTPLIGLLTTVCAILIKVTHSYFKENKKLREDFKLFENKVDISFENSKDKNFLLTFEKDKALGKLDKLQNKYNLLFISKLKLAAAGNPEFYKEAIKEELSVFLVENGFENVLDIALILTEDFKQQLDAVIQILDKKP